jgi:hypothetical protein
MLGARGEGYHFLHADSEATLVPAQDHYLIDLIQINIVYLIINSSFNLMHYE